LSNDMKNIQKWFFSSSPYKNQKDLPDINQTSPSTQI
jgi:hypothetical protein